MSEDSLLLRILPEYFFFVLRIYIGTGDYILNSNNPISKTPCTVNTIMAKQKKTKSQSENHSNSVLGSIYENEVSGGVCCNGCEIWAYDKYICPDLTISILESQSLFYRRDDCISHKKVKNTLSLIKNRSDNLSQSVAHRLDFMQEKWQKLENTVKTNATYAERVKQAPNLFCMSTQHMGRQKLFCCE